MSVAIVVEVVDVFAVKSMAAGSTTDVVVAVSAVKVAVSSLSSTSMAVSSVSLTPVAVLAVKVAVSSVLSTPVADLAVKVAVSSVSSTPVAVLAVKVAVSSVSSTSAAVSAVKVARSSADVEVTVSREVAYVVVDVDVAFLGFLFVANNDLMSTECASLGGGNLETLLVPPCFFPFDLWYHLLFASFFCNSFNSFSSLPLSY